MVQVLLRKGADTEISGIKWLGTGDWGWTPLMRAAWRGFQEIVKILVEAGADVQAKTARGQKASAIAREHGKETIFLYLRDLEWSGHP